MNSFTVSSMAASSEHNCPNYVNYMLSAAHSYSFMNEWFRAELVSEVFLDNSRCLFVNWTLLQLTEFKLTTAVLH